MNGTIKITKPLVAILGGSGNVGRHLIRHFLRSGWRVVCLSRSDCDIDGVVFQNFDLLTETINFSEAPDLFVHLAWFMERGSFWYHPNNEAYYQASLNLINCLGKMGVKHIAVAGTCAELMPYDKENELWSLGGSKKRLCVDLAMLSKKYGFIYSWFRIFYAFGEGEDHHKLLYKIRKNAILKSEVQNLSGKNDFISFDRVAMLMFLACQKQMSGVFDLGSGVLYEIENLFEYRSGKSKLIPFPPTADRSIVADVKWLNALNISQKGHKSLSLKSIEQYLMDSN